MEAPAEDMGVIRVTCNRFKMLSLRLVTCAIKKMLLYSK